MEKLDLAKKYRSYYTAKTTPAFITLEQAQYLSITGTGDPNGKEFSDKLQALYPVAYTLKFQCKAKDKDFVVAKLEGLWWFDEEKFGVLTIDTAPQKVPRSDWNWRLLIRIPDYVQSGDVNNAIEAAFNKQQATLVREVELFTMTEGKSVQALHVGPFDKEPETLQKIANFTKEHNLQRNGLHHEIYLSDFRKTAPDKLRTILREPVK